MSEESRNAPGAHHKSLLQRQHQASRAIAAAGDETAVGQALMDFAASGDVDAARVLLFDDVIDGQPTIMETREGWTEDNRPVQAHGSRFPLADYPLLKFLDASTAVVCENVETDPRTNEPVRQLMALSGVGSFAFIPLTAGHRDLESSQHAELDQVWLGAAFIARNTPSTYDQELIYAWWTLAGQAASAIENARLFASLQHAHQEQQRRSAELESLHETLLDLTQEQRDLNTVLEIISRRIMTLLDADGGGVWLWQEEDQELELVITFQVGGIDLAGRRLKPGEGLTGRAFVERKIQVIDDYPTWAGRSSTFDDAPIFAAMAVPMFWQNQVVGALVATRSQQGRLFSTREQRLAQLLTDQTATAVQNARLLAQTQAALAETASLYEASRRLTTAGDLQEMLAAVAKGVHVPAVNRAVLWAIEYNAAGEAVALSMTANWYSGEGRPPMPVGTRFSLEQFPDVQLAAIPEPIFSHNVSQDKRIDPVTRMTFEQEKVRAVALLPLGVGKRQLGTLMLASEQAHKFDEREIRLYHSLSGQMAVRVENRRLLEQTQVSEIRFRDVALSGGNWVWETNAQDRYTYCSEQVTDVLGYTPEEIIGKSPRSFIHPEDADHGIQVIAELAAAKQPIVDLESRALTKDGRVVTLLTNGVSVLDENGDLLGYRGVVKDVTVQREAQAEREHLLVALERRSAQLQAAAEVSRAASSILDPDELIQQVVDLAQERFGLYYAGLFMIEQTKQAGEWAVLKAGTGDAGRNMVEEAHKLQVGGKSMVGWCAANKQARIVMDVEEEPMRYVNPHLPETRSEMALPLISGGQAIGAMTIQSTQAAAFSEEDIATLQTMADQLAAAIDNARLYETTQARAEELAGLNELGQALTACVTTQGVLDEVHLGVSRLLGTANFYVTLYDSERDEITMALRLNEGKVERPDLTQPAGRGGLTDYLIQTRQPLLIQGNVAERVAELGMAQIRLSSRGSSVCWLGAPMLAGDQVLGTVIALDYADPRAYDEHSQELLTAIASQAAIAFQSARLFERAQARAQREQRIRAITDRVRRGADREAIMRITLEELGQMLGASRSVIRLGTQDQLGPAYEPAERPGEGD